MKESEGPDESHLLLTCWVALDKSLPFPGPVASSIKCGSLDWMIYEVFPCSVYGVCFFFLIRLPCREERAYTLPESTWLCQLLRADCCVALLSPVVNEVLVAA